MKVVIRAFLSSALLCNCCYLETRVEAAEVVIGNDKQLKNGFTAIAETSTIRSGRRCLVGPNALIIGSDFQGLPTSQRYKLASISQRPVSIGDDVLIGAGVIVLKRVSIDPGAVVEADAVVVSDISASIIETSNSAKVVRPL